MKIAYLIAAAFGALLMSGCKDNSPSQPTEVITGIGSLVSDTYVNGDFINLTVSADPGLAYGFDADPNSRDVYISTEVSKSNVFKMKNTYVFDLLAGDGGLISSITQTSDPHVSYTDIVTVTANDVAGSQKLIISIKWMDAGTYSRHDITNSRDDNGGLPISIYAKVCNKRTLADINIYYLYNTAKHFPDLKNRINKIYAQAVCGIDNVASINLNPDKRWDLNGNGQLDVYPDDPSNPNDEFASIKAWAQTQRYWNADNYGLIVLEKPIIAHNNDGTISSVVIPGMTDDVLSGVAASGNFTVVSSDADYDVVAHEYLHSKNSSNDARSLCLSDLTYDTYNLMFYLEFSTKNEVLRYRPETRLAGGTESQWNIMTGNSF